MMNIKHSIIACILFAVALCSCVCGAIFKETAAYMYIMLLEWMCIGAGFVTSIVGILNYNPKD